MATISLRANNQTLERVDRYDAYTESRNYLKYHITFSNDWIDKDVIVLFNDGKKVYSVEYDKNGDNKIPNFILDNQKFWISIFSADDVRITTNNLKIEFGKSGYTDNISSPTIPDSDLLSQLYRIAKTEAFVSATYEDNVLSFLNKEGDVVEEVEIEGGGSTPYYSFNKVKDYLYTADYDSIDYNKADVYFKEHSPHQFACSSLYKGNYLARNFDWLLNEEVEFIVRVPRSQGRFASIGVVGISEFDESYLLTHKTSILYDVLPFKILDGINENGVAVSTNVVPTDKGVANRTVPSIEHRDSVSTAMLCRYILDKFTTATEAVEYLRDYVEIYGYDKLLDMHYEQHYIVADKENCYVLELVEDSLKIMEKNFMTNFHLYDVLFNQDGSVYTPATQDDTHNAYDTNHVTLNGCGLERYNIINSDYDGLNNKSAFRTLLDKIKYSHTYTDEDWYTEFVGGGLTVKTDVETYAPIVQHYKDDYQYRTRDKESPYYGYWQTTHSSIYDLSEKCLYIKNQEQEEELRFDFMKIVKEITPNSTHNEIATARAVYEAGGAGGVQSDWEETDTSDLAYIKNKPIILTEDDLQTYTDNFARALRRI